MQSLCMTVTLLLTNNFTLPMQDFQKAKDFFHVM